jgi:3-oxocholest-4-en-26-oate---CoA ligase
MPGWNFADLWEICAELRGDAPAAVHGERTVSWAEFDRGANGLAHTLLDAGLRHQDKVAQYLTNDPAYMRSVLACFKAAMVPVNTNYRYGDDELVHLCGWRPRRPRSRWATAPRSRPTASSSPAPRGQRRSCCPRLR